MGCQRDALCTVTLLTVQQAHAAKQCQEKCLLVKQHNIFLDVSSALSFPRWTSDLSQ